MVKAKKTSSMLLNQFITQPKNDGQATEWTFFHGAGGDAHGSSRNPDHSVNHTLAIDFGYWQNRTFKHNFPHTKHVLQQDITKCELDYNKKVTLDFSLNTLHDLRNQRLKHDTEILTINYEGIKTSVKRFEAEIFQMSPPCQ